MTDIIWNPKTGELARDTRAVALPPRTAALFDYLRWHLSTKHPVFIPIPEIADHLGLDNAQARAVIQAFNYAADKLKLKMQGRPGRPGGYRLIDLAGPS